MAMNDDQRGGNLHDRAPKATSRAGESPDDLADSPTVKESELSPAQAVRGGLMEGQGSGTGADIGADPLLAPDRDPAATLTARMPQVEPDSPLGPGTGPLPAEDLPSAGGAGREPSTSAAMPQTDIPQAGTPGLADRSGTVAGLDETSGTDETTAARVDRG